MGFPPSSSGSFHFNETELRSYLSISTLLGSPGASRKQFNKSYNIRLLQLHQIALNSSITVKQSFSNNITIQNNANRNLNVSFVEHNNTLMNTQKIIQ